MLLNSSLDRVFHPNIMLATNYLFWVLKNKLTQTGPVHLFDKCWDQFFIYMYSSIF